MFFFSPTCGSCEQAGAVFGKWASKLVKEVNFVSVCVGEEKKFQGLPKTVKHLTADLSMVLAFGGSHSVPFAAVIGKKGKIAQVGVPEPVQGERNLQWGESLKRVLPGLNVENILTTAEKKRAQQMFRKFDLNQDRYLDKEELCQALAQPVMNIHTVFGGGARPAANEAADVLRVTQRVDELFERFDKDKNQLIDYQEFLSMFNFLQLEQLDFDRYCDEAGAYAERLKHLTHESEEQLPDGSHAVTTRDEGKIKALLEQLQIQHSTEDPSLNIWRPEELRRGSAYHITWNKGKECQVFIHTASGAEHCLAEVKYDEEGCRCTYYYGGIVG